MGLIVDQYGNPIRRKVGFQLSYVNEEEDGVTDAVGSRMITPGEWDTDEGQEEEPPQCR